MKTILSALALLSVIGCGKQVSVDPSPNSPTAVEYHGVCQLMNLSGAAVLCIDFPADSPSNATSCETTEKQRYAGVGVTGAEYVGVSNPASTSCALTNPGLSWAVNCSLSDRYIRYYAAFGQGSAAASDCTARSGFPSPNGEN